MSRWLVVMVLMTGCGFSLSGPDPQQPREQVPKCDTGKGAVVVDGLMATVASVVALALIANDEPAGALIPAGIGAIYIGGAVHGSRAVDACRQRMDEFSEMVAARDQIRRGPPGNDVEDPRLPPNRGKVPPPAPGQLADMPPPEQQTQLPPEQQTPPPQQVPPEQMPQQPPQQVAPQQQQPKQPKQTKQPKQKQPPPPAEDDWSDFWREVQ